MHSAPVRAACLMAGAILWSGGVATAQDANRDVVVTRSDAREIVRSLPKHTEEFKEHFDKAIEHSMIDGTKLEDRAKHRADDLHDSAKKLADVFDDKHDKNDPKVRAEVDRTLAAGADVNRIMGTHRFTDELQRDWSLVRSDLNALAAVYSLSPLN